VCGRRDVRGCASQDSSIGAARLLWCGARRLHVWVFEPIGRSSTRSDASNRSNSGALAGLDTPVYLDAAADIGTPADIRVSAVITILSGISTRRRLAIRSHISTRRRIAIRSDISTVFDISKRPYIEPVADPSSGCQSAAARSCRCFT
jgi:hypothetical protein